MDIPNPNNLTALDPKVTADNGGDFEALLQPVHRVDYSIAVADLAAALVAAGIMNPA